MKINEIITEDLRVDVPNEDWLQDQIDYAIKKGRNHNGVPYMGKGTGNAHDVRVPVSILQRLPGMSREQENVRDNDLRAIMKIMKDTGKLPLGRDGTEYAPFINVAYNGEAWVNEGNHRIMAATKLGWDSLPVDIRYFDGGERIEHGPMYPGKIGLGGEIDEDWKSKLATGAMAGAMAIGAHAKSPDIVQQYVEPGDTVYSIARQNNVDPKEIYQLNKMDRNTKLEIGQRVLVPDYAKPTVKEPARVVAKSEPVKATPVAKPEPSFKDRLASMLPSLPPVAKADDKDGVTLLSNNSDAEAALQTAAKASGLKGVELAQFMAQTRHESADFAKMKEVGSKKQFAQYEKPSLARRLGNKAKGDGERFKGRGFIQLTGRDNYTRASQQIFGDNRLLKNPDLASDLDVAAKIAIWYWKNQVRPSVKDFNNTVDVVRAINANEPMSVIRSRHNKFKEYLAVL